MKDSSKNPAGKKNLPPPLFPGRKRGFTLVEVITALAILMTGLFLLARTFVLGTRQKAANKNLTAAYSLAGEKIEESLAGAREAGGACESGRAISWKRDFAQSVIPGMSEVTVTVYWEESGKNREFILRTLIPHEDE